MFDVFTKAKIAHVHVTPEKGEAHNTVISAQDFKAAFDEISGWDGYATTPVHHLLALARELNLCDIIYKDEGPRFGLGSFKALGGAYAGLQVLRRELSARLGKEVSAAGIRSGQYHEAVGQITLASATDGNHGRSLAWGAQSFGAACQIYIHREVSETRAQVMRDLGAEVVRVDGDYDASVDQVRRDADARGWHVVSDTSWAGYSQPPRDVMAGYGVMVAEIVAALEEAPTHVFMQGGVGGLAASIASGLRQHYGDQSPRLVVVEPELAACLWASAGAGRLTNIKIDDETLMAGLSCGEPSPMAWQILHEEVTDYLTIPENLVAPTMQLAARPHGNDPVIQAGESAVAGLAALIAVAQGNLRGVLGLSPASRVLIIGSEGITDPEIYARLVG